MTEVPGHIAIDGIDGSGKTTQAQIIVNYLEKKGYKVYYSKFKPFAAKPLIDISLGINSQDVSGRQTFKLSHLEYVYACDEYLNYYEIIKPKLENGYTVIQDRSKMTRYVNSQIASCPYFDIEKILSSITDPTITILLNVSPEIASKRLDLRGYREKDESLTFLKHSAELFLQNKHLIRNLFVIDGNNNIEQVKSEILNLLCLKLNF